jgi:phosphoserine aminotransferase
MRHALVNEPYWQRDYLAPSIKNGDTTLTIPLMVFAQALGGGQTSLLYQDLVMKQKLATQVSASYNGFSLGPETFTISATPAHGVSIATLEKAVDEARRVASIAGLVHVAGSTEKKGAPADGFIGLLRDEEIALDPNAAFLHLCTNETIYGVEVQDDCAALAARVRDVPLVADMSSHILSRSVDVSRYGLIYAGAQKNIGPSGLVITIVREDLLGRAVKAMPSLMDFALAAENGSMINTPPTFSIYIAGLVFKWLKRQGGVAAMEQVNIRKAKMLYGCIDASDGFYRNPVELASRSRMNVPFTLRDPALDEVFLKQAQSAGLYALKGHKTVGGMRASIYNAMSEQGVKALVDFMTEFAKVHAK